MVLIFSMNVAACIVITCTKYSSFFMFQSRVITLTARPTFLTMEYAVKSLRRFFREDFLFLRRGGSRWRPGLDYRVGAETVTTAGR